MTHGAPENVELVERFLAAFDRRRSSACASSRCPVGKVVAHLVGLPRQQPAPLLERVPHRLGVALAPGRVDQVRLLLGRPGELAIDAGPWPAGTRLAAWCVGRYRVEAGRIVEIEHHDCYEPPSR